MLDIQLFGKGQKACRNCKAEYNKRSYQDPAKREEKLAHNRAYKKANREALLDYERKWRADNPDKVMVTRKKYESKITSRLSKNLTHRIKTSFGLLVKKEQIPYYLGCTVEQWMEHLKKGFTPGMGWVNYGQGERAWEVDHIFPLSKSGMTIDDIIRALHYTNTRPLWGHDNRVKGAKIPLMPPESAYQSVA